MNRFAKSTINNEWRALPYPRSFQTPFPKGVDAEGVGFSDRARLDKTARRRNPLR